MLEKWCLLSNTRQAGRQQDAGLTVCLAFCRIQTFSDLFFFNDNWPKRALLCVFFFPEKMSIKSEIFGKKRRRLEQKRMKTPHVRRRVVGIKTINNELPSI